MSEISKLEQNLIIKKIDNQTVNISINENEMLMSIVGQFDQNLKHLSKLTKTDVYFRGNSITCCLLYTSPSPRDQRGSRMPSSA